MEKTQPNAQQKEKEKLNNGIFVIIRILMLVVLMFICFKVYEIGDQMLPRHKNKTARQIVNHYLFWD